MVKNILSKDGYLLSKKKLTEKQLNDIKTDLTVKPKFQEEYSKDSESFPVYKETASNLIVPRYYGIKNFGQPLNKINTSNSLVDFEFNGKLRENQMEVVQTILNKIKNEGGGILQLHTGYGKTTIALYLASVLKLKTLVVVHKTFLQDQWYDRIKQFTNANIGIIRQKKIDVDRKDIIIGMLQSISMIDYDPEIFKDINLLIIDECFPGYTQIATNKGNFSIFKLYDLWKKKEEIPLIKSYNDKTKKFEYKQMTFGWKKYTKELVEVQFGKKTIDCTPNHKFLTTLGYKEAKILTNNDILIGIYDDKLRENVFAKGLNDDQIQIVLGSFLGDGNIDMTKNDRYRLRIQHGIDQKEYCEWKAKIFNCKTKYVGTNKFSKKQIMCFQTKLFDFENKFPKKKTFCPQWILDKIDFRAIAIWFMDDGSINKKTLNLKISTCHFNEDSQKLLVKKLTDLNFYCHYYKDKRGYYYINLNKKGTINLISKIYSYMLIFNNLKYKIISKLLLNHLEDNFTNLKKYKWNNNFLEIGTCRVTDVINIKNIKNLETCVYDIEVENNHNFIVCGKNNNIGPVVHNCHHIGSKVFSKALLKIGAKHTIGLSATPNRSDGLTKILKWFLGDILVKVERKGDNTVYIKSFEYKSKDKLFIEKKRWFNGKIKPDVVKMITNMYKMNDRNNFIANILNALRKKDGRKTIVLSGRIEHLKSLKTLVDNLIQKDIQEGVCEIDEFKTSFYIGGMKEYELKDSEEADIIFATYAMAEEGLDIDGLNTLVLATPKKNIIQSIGRIMRKPIKEGDTNPLIVDITDDLSVFKNWGNIRLKYYNTHKYNIESYKALGEQCLDFKDFLISEGIMNKKEDNLDVRKAYIVNKFGIETYNFEEELEFINFPDSMFNYSVKFDDIFEIEHDYTSGTNCKIEIDLLPNIEI